jgi:hypothetical protein
MKEVQRMMKLEGILRKKSNTLVREHKNFLVDHLKFELSKARLLLTPNRLPIQFLDPLKLQ